MTYLKDEHRVEIALPARLIWGIAKCECFGPDPNAPDQEEAKQEVIEKQAELVRLLTIAKEEPLADLFGKRRRTVENRILRLEAPIAAKFDDKPAVSVALTCYFFLKDLLDRQFIFLHEGSPFEIAMTTIFIPAMEAGLKAAATLPDDEERIDRAAQRRARKLLDRLQERGYYREDPLPMAAE